MLTKSIRPTVEMVCHVQDIGRIFHILWVLVYVCLQVSSLDSEVSFRSILTDYSVAHYSETILEAGPLLLSFSLS